MNRGYSLIEILITLTIASILLVIVLPNQTFLLQHANAKLASTQLLTAIQFARHTAVTQHATVVLCKSHDQKTCSGQWGDGYIIQVNQETIQAFTQHNSQANIYWRAFPANQDNLIFSANGETQFENGTFWYCANDAKNPSWAIVVNQAGRCRLVKPNVNGQLGLNVGCNT